MVDEEGEDEVVFPWPGQALYCLAQSLCSRLLSHYFMTSLTLFSSSRPPIALALIHPSPHPSPRSSSPRPPRHLLSRPRLTSSFPSSTIRLSFSSGRLTPNNTRFGHKSRTCPPQPPISLSTRLPLHVPPLHPIVCSIRNGLDRWPLASPTLLPPSLPPFSASLQVRCSPNAPPRRTVKYTYNTHRSDRFSAHTKRESSPSLFSFSSRTHDCSDGNFKPLPIHHHPILSGTLSGYLLPSMYLLGLGPTGLRPLLSHVLCLRERPARLAHGNLHPNLQFLSSRYVYDPLASDEMTSLVLTASSTACLGHVVIDRRLLSFLPTSARTGL